MNKEPLLVKKEDYTCIEQVSTHCTYDTLCIYIRERQNKDILELLGNSLYTDILDNQDKYHDLLNGCKFTGCDGNTNTHFGIKRILAHFAYGAYMLRSGIVDTPFSAVHKTNDFSIPVPQETLKSVNVEQRRIAFSYWDATKRYICLNIDKYPLFDKNNCTNVCSCSNSCGCNSNAGYKDFEIGTRTGYNIHVVKK